MTMKCSKPNCRSKAALALLGGHPLCRQCGDEKNRKARLRSARRRAAGLYPPSSRARWSAAKKMKMEEAAETVRRAVRTSVTLEHFQAHGGLTCTHRGRLLRKIGSRERTDAAGTTWVDEFHALPSRGKEESP